MCEETEWLYVEYTEDLILQTGDASMGLCLMQHSVVSVSKKPTCEWSHKQCQGRCHGEMEEVCKEAYEILKPMSSISSIKSHQEIMDAASCRIHQRDADATWRMVRGKSFREVEGPQQIGSQAPDGRGCALGGHGMQSKPLAVSSSLNTTIAFLAL